MGWLCSTLARNLGCWCRNAAVLWITVALSNISLLDQSNITLHYTAVQFSILSCYKVIYLYRKKKIWLWRYRRHFMVRGGKNKLIKISVLCLTWIQFFMGISIFNKPLKKGQPQRLRSRKWQKGTLVGGGATSVSNWQDFIVV